MENIMTLDEYKCKICMEYMITSVITSDQYAVHEACVGEYFESTNEPKSLVTNERLSHTGLVPNTLANVATGFLCEYTNLFDEHFRTMTKDHIVHHNLYDMICNSEKLRRLVEERELKESLVPHLFNLVKCEKQHEILKLLTPQTIDIIAEDVTCISKLMVTACLAGLHSVVIELMKNPKADINFRDDNGNNLFIAACISDFPDICKELLEKGVILEGATSTGATSFMAACSMKTPDVGLALLKTISNVEELNRVDKMNNSALTVACQYKNTTVALLLLEREGINYNQVNSCNVSILCTSCFHEQEEVALKILDMKDVNVNCIDDMGATALMWACRNSLERVALKLLEVGKADVTIIDGSGSSALTLAAKKGLSNVILRILDIEDIDVNHQDGDNNSALLYVCMNEKPLMEVIEKMLGKKGIDVNNETGYEHRLTPLNAACKMGHGDIAMKLLGCEGIDIGKEDSTGTAALMWACDKGLREVAFKLIDMGCDVNNVDMFQNTSLIMCCANGVEDVALKLLENPDIDVNMSNIDDLCALTLACDGGMEKVVLKMLERGKEIDVNVMNSA